jgi:hypothetical protein
MESLNLSQDFGGDNLSPTVQKVEQTEPLLSSPDSDVEQTINDVLVEDEVLDGELYRDIVKAGDLVRYIDTDIDDGLAEESSASELWTAGVLFSFLCSNGISYFNIETKDLRVLQAPRSFLAGLVYDTSGQLTFNLFESTMAFMFHD